MLKKLNIVILVIVIIFSSFSYSGAFDYNNDAIKKISLGQDFGALLKYDGSLWLWGNLFESGINSSGFKINNISGIKDIKAGVNHLAILKNDGSVYILGHKYWIDESLEQDMGVLEPYKISELSDVKEIASGKEFILALLEDGSVMALGNNDFGQLGTGDLENNKVAEKVKTITDIKVVAAGYNHSIAIDNEGNVWTWGSNEFGEACRGVEGGIYKTPSKAAGIINPRDVVAGYGYSIFLFDGGTLKSVGKNDMGQLGLKDFDNRNMAKNIPEIEGIVKMAAGFGHVVAMDKNTCVYTWGNNVNEPTKLSMMSAVDVSAGTDFSGVLKTDGRLWTFGNNNFGQLANSATIVSSSEIKVEGLKDVISISASDYSAFAIDKSGNVKGWGNNADGQLGNLSSIITKPTSISGISSVKSIDGGVSHSIFLKSDGTVYAIGNNDSAQIGDESQIGTKIPQKISWLSNINYISTGTMHNLALSKEGKVYSWGSNEYGQLGNGGIGRVTEGSISGLQNIKSVSAGLMHSLALDNSGNVWSWGDNYSSQLGHSGNNVSIPNKITGISKIKSISAGSTNSLALDETGNVWEWGNGILTPSKVTGINAVKSIVAGNDFNVAINSLNDLYIWGTFLSKKYNTPTKIGSGKNKVVMTGNDFIIVQKLDGTVYTMGTNIYGQLGNGVIINPPDPVLSTVYKVANKKIIVVVDNKVMDFADTEPIISNGRTLVPLRGVFEEIGAKLDWEQKAKTITCVKGAKKIVLQINNKTAYVDGVAVTLEAVPELVGGRTLVPLRFISQSLGAVVDWDKETRTAIIVSK